MSGESLRWRGRRPTSRDSRTAIVRARAHSARHDRACRSSRGHGTTQRIGCGRDLTGARRDLAASSGSRCDLADYTIIDRGYERGDAIVPAEYDGELVTSVSICFRVERRIDVDGGFLTHMLESRTVPRQLEALHGGYDESRVSSVAICDGSRCVVPPLEEQRRIAEILDTIDETIQATERVIAKLLADGMTAWHRATSRRAR